MNPFKSVSSRTVNSTLNICRFHSISEGSIVHLVIYKQSHRHAQTPAAANHTINERSDVLGIRRAPHSAHSTTHTLPVCDHVLLNRDPCAQKFQRANSTDALIIHHMLVVALKHVMNEAVVFIMNTSF